MYFSEYGDLEWLEPTEYYAGPWTYVGFADGADEEPYDLVRNLDTMEMRYTNI